MLPAYFHAFFKQLFFLPQLFNQNLLFLHCFLLKDCNFVRIHKSYVVNMEHFKEYIRGEGGMVIMSNGQKLDVSKRKKELLVSRMKEYFKF